jgi:hypothetical protein
MEDVLCFQEMTLKMNYAEYSSILFTDLQHLIYLVEHFQYFYNNSSTTFKGKETK